MRRRSMTTAAAAAGMAAAVTVGLAVAAPASAAPARGAAGAGTSTAQLHIANAGCDATVGGKVSNDRTVWFTATPALHASLLRLTVAPTAGGDETQIGRDFYPESTATFSSINGALGEIATAAVPADQAVTYRVEQGDYDRATGRTSYTTIASTDVTPCTTGSPQRWPLYKGGFSDTIYELRQGTVPVAISAERWSAFYGNARPVATRTDFVKYPWDPNIVAVTYWNGSDVSDSTAWQWTPLSSDQWRRAGSPTPRTAGYIYGSRFVKYVTSDELFAVGPSAGGEPGNYVFHKLSYSEWRESDFASFDAVPTGFEKTTWAPEIALLTDFSTGAGRPLSYYEWDAFAFPTPRAVQRIPGDQFYKTDCSAATIYYAGPQVNRAVSYREWVAAGSPTPKAGAGANMNCP